MVHPYALTTGAVCDVRKGAGHSIFGMTTFSGSTVCLMQTQGYLRPAWWFAAGLLVEPGLAKVHMLTGPSPGLYVLSAAVHVCTPDLLVLQHNVVGVQVRSIKQALCVTCCTCSAATGLCTRA
jgi:hypothetical protein